MREAEPVAAASSVAGASAGAAVAVSADDDWEVVSDDALTLEKIAGAIDVSELEVEPEASEEDVTKMLARLREEARKTYEGDEN